MRIVDTIDELIESVSSARREARSAFGNGTVFLEKYVESPRHIEVQIFGDRFGNVVHLGERECSIQRRYQKIIEESPSTAVSEALRNELGSAAVSAGKALNYEGAGTVEFVMAPDGAFYFLEVNTRLQVEHPVTELVTGTDLVRAQVLVASGHRLPPEIEHPSFSGHAVEVRLYAEDAESGFVPVAGRLTTFELPVFPGVRVDSGFVSGSVVSTFYDPMLAKVIGYGRTRDEACNRVARALVEARIHGVTTNRDLLVGILREPEFRTGRTDTGYLARHSVADLTRAGDPTTRDRVHAAVAALSAQSQRRSDARILPGVPSGFRTVRSASQMVSFVAGDTEIDVRYSYERGQPVVSVAGTTLGDVEVFEASGSTVDASIDGVRRLYRVVSSEGTYFVDSSLGATELREVERFPDPTSGAESGSLLAPMPGSVVRIDVTEGQQISQGEAVIVLEAMKMEHTIRAPLAGTVAKLPVTVGQQVDSGTVLAVLQEDDADDATSEQPS